LSPDSLLEQMPTGNVFILKCCKQVTDSHAMQRLSTMDIVNS